MTEVPEADATGEVAEIYADIKATMGMPFVNLVWRRLALCPEGLCWTWRTTKRLYADGVVLVESVALLDDLDLPQIPRCSPASLRAAGVDMDAEAAIREVLTGYDRGNSLNILAFSAVLALLRGETAARSGPATQIGRASIEAMQRPTSPPPAMVSEVDMDPATSELVRAFNVLAAFGVDRAVKPSLPRHLAHWPGFLRLGHAMLAPLAADGRLRAAAMKVTADGLARGRVLAADLGAAGRPPPDVAARTAALIEPLAPDAMGRMIPIVRLLLQMLPR